MIEHKGIDTPRPDVANRVVAWHNRHPLARRIAPAQVRHVGLVVLPFAAQEGHALEAPRAASEPEPEPEACGQPGPSPTPSVDPADSTTGSVEVTLGGDGVEAPPSQTEDAGADVEHGDDQAAGDEPPLTAPPLQDRPAETGGLDTAPPPTSADDLRADVGVAPARQTPQTPLPWWRRLGRRPAPVSSQALFTEAVIPSLGARGLAELATKHGLAHRPPGEHWPERVAQVDRDCTDAAKEIGLAGRADRVLLTATIDDGTRRLRVVIGGGVRPVIVGPRLWDRRRVGTASALALAAVVAAAWSLGYRTASTDSAAAALATRAPAGPIPAAVAVASSSAPASNPANELATHVPTDLPVAAATQAPAAVPASAPEPHEPPANATAKAAEPMGLTSLPASPVSAPAIAGLGPAAQRRSIAPNLRPQLSAAVPTEPKPQFALVSAPLRSRADADSMLRRLRGETSQLRHPVAVETSTLPSGQGWRVSWWPFANRRQAENARAALAGRRIEMDVVDF